MKILEILDHKFQFVESDDNNNERYICITCKADVDKFITDNAILIWDDNEDDYIELISCNEYIIKSIIE